MRRLFVTFVVCAAVMVAATPASAGPSSIRRAKVDAHRVRATPVLQVIAFAPLARRLAGGATVTADMYQGGTSPSVGGTARLLVRADDGSVIFNQEATSGAGGRAVFTGVPATDGRGEIAYRSPTSEGTFAYDVRGLSWSDPSGAALTLHPGSVPITLYADGGWAKYFRYAFVDSFTSEAGVTKLAEHGFARSTASAPSTYIGAKALAGTLEAMNAYFFFDEGVEVVTSRETVTPGYSTPNGVFARESDAQRISNGTWASGKPGSAFKLHFDNFPAGWVNRLLGDDAATGLRQDKSFGSWTSSGKGRQTRTLTIPKSSTPGYTYRIWAEHTNGPGTPFGLALYEPFQVCTLNPSRSVIGASGSVSFSGRVPFVSGATKRVILYRRYRSGGQPPYSGGFRAAKGWTKIASASTNGSGRFRFARIPVTRTAWYCLWYPEDPQHWGAWTSVVKVARR